MQIPQVSIIIPVYNVEKYIVKCLQSVSEQTVAGKIQCIVVDDRGQDDSIQRVEDFISNYDGPVQYQLVRREKNGGLSAARNSGIRVSHGEYLYFLDGDDYIVPNCIETLLKIAGKYEGVDLLPALYISDLPYMKQFGTHSFPEFSEDKGTIKKALLDYDIIPVTAANRLIRREFILKYNLFFKEGIIHEDIYWTFFVAKYVERMAFCPSPLYFYRENEDSITQKVDINKEERSYRIIISEFCHEIDSFEIGAQKRLIFNILLLIKENGFYGSEESFIQMMSELKDNCFLSEQWILYLSLKKTHNSFLSIFGRKLLSKLFKDYQNCLFFKIEGKLISKLNFFIRNKYIIPSRRKEFNNLGVSIISSNCLGAYISHTLGNRHNSPFVNLWLYPKDFIKYCKNISHYKETELKFLSSDAVLSEFGFYVTYPVAKLDDITIFFMHYDSKEEAEKKWIERTNRIDMSNLRFILAERDGCCYNDLIEFSKIPNSISIVHKVFPQIPNACYVRGFENLGFVGNVMQFVKNQVKGKMYFDDFDYVSFLNKKEC